MKEHLQNVLKFSELLNRFRLVERVMYANGLDRMENDVEHSYQLAMTAWYAASSKGLDLHTGLLIKYALSHDLLETYSGDTDVFSNDFDYTKTKQAREEMARKRMETEFQEFPELHDVIRSYESREDSESRFVYAWDGTHPIFNVCLDNGRLYREKGITWEMIRDKRGLKASASPEVLEYFECILQRVRSVEERSINAGYSENIEIDRMLSFCDFLNRFRLVNRMMRVNGAKRLRQENDVEHSYQLAMLAWYIASSRKLNMDTDLIVKYALVHDLVEVYAGDTYVFSQDQEHLASKEEREKKALERIACEFPEFPDLYKTIVRYEKKQDRESRFVYALDKIQPVINYYLDGGRSYKDIEVSIDMVLETRAKKVSLSPEVKEYFDEMLTLLYENEHIFTKKSKPRFGV